MKNNTILKKISIAQNLRHFEMKEIFELGGLKLSSSQIKAYMAGPSNKNYEKITSEDFESFLNGMIVFSRGEKDEPTTIPRAIEHYVLGLMQAGHSDALDELRCLVEDAKDGIVQGCDAVSVSVDESVK
ncbi:MAG: DUF1456 family protein [Zetaproteobacteria bacterium]|nr:DUF1456 family protein [Zetaproteobacteria bacterium]